MDERIAHSAADDLPESSVDNSPSVGSPSDSGLFLRMRDLLKNRIGQAMIATGIVSGIVDHTAPTVDAAEKIGSISAKLGGDSKGRATSVRIDGKTIGVDEDGVLNDVQIQRGVPYYDENGQLLYRKGGQTSRIQLDKEPRAFTAKPVLPKEHTEEPIVAEKEGLAEKPAVEAEKSKELSPAELLSKTLPKGTMINPHMSGILKHNMGTNLPKDTRTWVMNPIATEPNGRNHRGVSVVPPEQWETVRHTMTCNVTFHEVVGGFEATLILPLIQGYSDVGPLQTTVHVSDTGLEKEAISFVVGTTKVPFPAGSRVAKEGPSTAFINLHIEGFQPRDKGKISIPVTITIATDVVAPVSNGVPTMAAVGRSMSAVPMIGLRPGIEGASDGIVERGVVRSSKDAVPQEAFFPIHIGGVKVEPKDPNFIKPQFQFRKMPHTGVKMMKGAESIGESTIEHSVEKLEEPDEEVEALAKAFIEQRRTINKGGLALGAVPLPGQK